MADETLVLEAKLKNLMSGEFDKISKQLNEFEKNSRDAFSSANKNANSFTNTLKGFVGGQAIIGATRKAYSTLQSTIQEGIQLYGIQVKAEAQLRNSLGYTSVALLEQASALQKLTTFGDEATIRAQALISAFVKEEEQILRVMPLVQDLAAAKGMNLAAAADLVSKTLGSSTNAMSRYGIEVSGAVGSTERLETLMISLEKAFGGTAQAIANTDIGRIEQMANEIGDIKETIGKEMIPVQLEWNRGILTATNLFAEMLTGVTKQSGIMGKIFGGMSIETIKTERFIDETLPKIEGFGERLQTVAKEESKIFTELNKQEEKLETLQSGDALDITIRRQENRVKQLRIQYGMLRSARLNIIEQDERERRRVSPATTTTTTAAATTTTKDVDTELEKRKQLLNKAIELEEKFNRLRVEGGEEPIAKYGMIGAMGPESEKGLQQRIENYMRGIELMNNADADRNDFLEKIHEDEMERAEKSRQHKINELNYNLYVDDLIMQSRRDLTNLSFQLGEMAIKNSKMNARSQQEVLIGMAIARAAVASVAAVQKAWTSSKTWQEGLAKGLSSGAIITGQTAASIMAIKAQRFQHGGIVGGNGGIDSRLIMASPGEMVLTKEDQTRLLNGIRGSNTTNNRSSNITINIPPGATVDSAAINGFQDNVLEALNQLSRDGRLENWQ